jgi:hypothetical protein
MTDYAWAVMGYMAAAVAFGLTGFILVLRTLPPKR